MFVHFFTLSSKTKSVVAAHLAVAALARLCAGLHGALPGRHRHERRQLPGAQGARVGLARRGDQGLQADLPRGRRRADRRRAPCAQLHDRRQQWQGRRLRQHRAPTIVESP